MPRKQEIISLNSFHSGEVEQKEEATIYVHITGAIYEPGIKNVPKYTRLFELIDISGGALEDADLSKINLASVLKDEQKIVIPYKVVEDDGQNINNLHDKENKSDSTSSLININYATINELMTLNGIGDGMAKRIIDYREENGPFNDIEDIKNVSRNWGVKIQ